MTNTFLDRVHEIMVAQGFPSDDSPAALLSAWEAFIQECKSGYNWDVSEYRNELAVRNRIEAILIDARAREFPEHDELAIRVAVLDKQFRDLLQPGTQSPYGDKWWERGVLAFAGDEYAEFYRSAYDIVVPNKRLGK